MNDMTAAILQNHVITISPETAEITLDPAELTEFNKVTLVSAAQNLGIYIHCDNTAAEKEIQLELKLAPHTKTQVFYRISGGAVQITSDFALAKTSKLDVFSHLSNTNSRTTFNATISEEAEATFTGLSELAQDEKSVIEVHVHHTEGKNLTQQKFYSYAADTSTIVFTGRITVSPGAGGSVAHQLHRGVNLSSGARIDAQPFLNIMHDDVRCTHGSTVGFIDEDAQRYLMARGIERQEAEKMLILSSQIQFYNALPHKAAADFFKYQEAVL
jgi:Fe-S cluster assembly scaffold protein SufB